MSEKNIQVIQNIYAAFGRGDVPAIMEHVSDELRLFGVVSETNVPWHLQIKKKSDVPLFFKALAENVDFTSFNPHDFSAAGDYVYATVSFDVVVKKNGKKAHYDCAIHKFTFKNGRIVEWRGSEDTAKTQALLSG